MNQRPSPVSLLIGLLLLSTSACKVNLPAATCPEQGGPAWHELTVPHFVVNTDLPLDQARKAAVDLETSYLAITAALGVTEPPSARPERTVIFARESELQVLGFEPNRWMCFGLRFPFDLEFQPTTVKYQLEVYLGRRLTQWMMVRHILLRHTATLPWWLEAGLAQTYSTVRVEGGGVIVGERPLDADFWEKQEATLELPGYYKTWFPAARAPSITALAAVNDEVAASADGNLYDTAAWKLVQVLAGQADPGLAPAFVKMREALLRGTPASRALSDAYPGMALGDFQGAYRKSLLDRHDTITRIELPGLAGIEPVVEPMTDVDVHALWATISKGAVAAEKQMARALEEKPGNATLLLARAAMRAKQGDFRGAEADLWSVRDADRATARYLFVSLYIAVSRLTAEKDAEARTVRLASLAPLVDKLLPLASTSAQRSFSALALAELHRTDEAVALMQKVVEADPFCGECFDLQAKVLLAAGQLPAASRAAERALFLSAGSNAPNPTLDLYHRIEHEAGKRGAP